MSDQPKSPGREETRTNTGLRPIYVALTGGEDNQRSDLKAVLAQINQLEIKFVSDTAPAGGANVPILMAILDDRNRETWRHELRSRKSGGQFLQS